MPALSVLDLAMFVLESRERHFNVGPLIVIDPPEKQRAKFADRLLARMMKRPVGPPFNYKLRIPLLGVPSLEVDADSTCRGTCIASRSTRRAACSNCSTGPANCTSGISTARIHCGRCTSSTGSRVARSRCSAGCTTA